MMMKQKIEESRHKYFDENHGSINFSIIDNSHIDENIQNDYFTVVKQ